MNLAELITSFHKHTSSLATDIDDPEVQTYLDRAYQYTIPLDVDGEMMEQIWQLTCVVDQQDYPYPNPLISSSGKNPWIESKLVASVETAIGLKYLGNYNEPVVFKRRYLSTTNSGQPCGVLFYGKVARLDRPANDEYIINIPVRSGPLLPLDSNGITHGTHAMAVVTAAALDFLSEIESPEDSGTQRESMLYARYRNQLRTYSLSRPNERRPARSF